MTPKTLLALALCGLFTLAGCMGDPPATPGQGGNNNTDNNDNNQGPATTVVAAKLHKVDANGTAPDVSGWAFFWARGDHLYIHVFATGLTGASQRGVHIHENASCAPANGVAAGAAGGHWNPGGHAHGAHAGDLLKNMQVVNGNGSLAVVRPNLTLDEGGNLSVLGKSVVIHQQADDFQSATSSGGRALCGVIERVPLADLPARAAAELHQVDANGTGARSGLASFASFNGSLYVGVFAENLTGGASQRGVHIHENASCAPANGTAAGGAGGHWNPAGQDHGAHAGDLMKNMEVDPGTGIGTLGVVRPQLTVNATGERSILGKSLIVHQQADDFQSATSSGGRALCGLIERA